MPPRLLLVEDDPTSSVFLAAAGEALPATVDTAGTVAAARALATQHRYDLWLVDAHLPDGSGTDLLSALRAHGLRTPALAHTAARDRTALDALLAAGFVVAVSKPLSADAWRSALREALAGAAVAQGAAASDSRARTDDGDSVAALSRPLWDDRAALAAMNGRREHVEALRGLFRAELPTIRAATSAAVAAGDNDALFASLHKLRASCGFVGAARLDAAARALRAAPASRHALSQFHAVLQDTLSS